MGAGVFCGLWLNSFSGDPARLDVFCGRRDLLIKVVFPCVRVLLEQRKRGLKVVKTLHSKREEKSNRKAIFRRYTKSRDPAGKVKLIIKASHMSRTVMVSVKENSEVICSKLIFVYLFGSISYTGAVLVY